MKLRLVFFGTPAFAVPFLRALADDADVEVAAVVSQPDRPVGRKRLLEPTPTKAFAASRGLPVLQPAWLKADETVSALRALGADAFVIVAYGRIIPKSILELPRLGCVNVHPSLLPRWRGPSPMPSEIAAGDVETGVSVMLLDETMDTGPLLAVERIPVAPDETAPSLEAKVLAVGTPLLLKALKAYAAGKIKPVPQAADGATVCKILAREDGKIDWTKSAAEIDRLRRAYQPWPGLWTTLDGVRVKILEIRSTDRRIDPGRLQVENRRLFVGTGSVALELIRIQPEGAPVMDVPAFLNGRQNLNDKRFS